MSVNKSIKFDWVFFVGSLRFCSDIAVFANNFFQQIEWLNLAVLSYHEMMPHGFSPVERNTF